MLFKGNPMNAHVIPSLLAIIFVVYGSAVIDPADGGMTVSRDELVK
jgi:hypothetical protein